MKITQFILNLYTTMLNKYITGLISVQLADFNFINIIDLILQIFIL